MEVSFMDESGEQMTRVQTVKLPLTEDREMFLGSVDGFVTGVLVAKDVCGNVGMVGVLYLAEFAVMSRFSARTVSAKKLQISARVL